MAINRFYNPSRGQYVSQFVPNELPAELLLKGILAKRNAENEQTAQVDKLAEWDMNVLEGDYEAKEKRKQAIRSFVDNMYGQELSSPDNIRKYKNFVREFKDAKEIKGWEAEYAHDAEMQKTKKELQEAGNDAFNEAYWDEYQRKRDYYNQNKGWLGQEDVRLTGHNLSKGTNMLEGYKKLYDHIKADGSTSTRKLGEEGYNLAYTQGWEGVDPTKIRNATLKEAVVAYQSDLGRQFRQQYKSQNIPAYDNSGKRLTFDKYFNSLSSDEKKEFEANMLKSFIQEADNVGQTFTYQKTTDNKATALNTAIGYGRQDEKENPPLLLGTVDIKGATPELNWDAKIKRNNSKIEEAKAALEIAKANPLLYGKDFVRNKENEIKYLETNNETLLADKRAVYNAEVSKFLKPEQFKEYSENYKELKRIEEKINKIKKDYENTKVDVGDEKSRSIYTGTYNTKLVEALESQKRRLEQKVNKYKSQMDQVNANFGKHYETSQGALQTVTTIQLPKQASTALNNQIQQAGGEGYIIEAIMPDGSKRTLNYKDLMDFQVGNMTQEPLSGGANSYLGTASVRIENKNEKTGALSYQYLKGAQVIMTPEKNVGRANNKIISYEYQKYSNMAAKAGKQEEARISANHALKLQNPEVADKMWGLEKSTDGRITGAISVGSTLGKTSVVKRKDGTYGVTILDDTGNPISTEKEFPNYPSAVDFLINFSNQ